MFWASSISFTSLASQNFLLWDFNFIFVLDTKNNVSAPNETSPNYWYFLLFRIHIFQYCWSRSGVRHSWGIPQVSDIGSLRDNINTNGDNRMKYNCVWILWTCVRMVSHFLTENRSRIWKHIQVDSVIIRYFTLHISRESFQREIKSLLVNPLLTSVVLYLFISKAFSVKSPLWWISFLTAVIYDDVMYYLNKCQTSERHSIHFEI